MKAIERIYEFEAGAARDEVFRLLSDARCLNEVTPPWFDLAIRSSAPEEMFLGKEISYRLQWRWLRFLWKSRITAWEPPSFFAYEQVSGPFRSFVHEHSFFEGDGATWVRDRVIYRPPGGRLADHLLVCGDLGRIFAYRREAVDARLRRA